MPETDRELIARTREGENAAFGTLWERYRGKVLRLCRSYLRSLPEDPVTDAEDLLTETFIRVLHCLDRYEDRPESSAGFEPWLMEVARNHCLNHLARHRRRARLWSDGLTESDLRPCPRPSPDRIVEERHLLRLAAQEINGLPPLYRVPFKLSLEEWSQQEIAEALGISVENASKRIQRARRMLQPRMTAIFALPPTQESGMVRGSSKTLLHKVERVLVAIVKDYRIVTIRLPGGGEKQLCLRTERAHADREVEIVRMRTALEGRTRAWKRRLELAHICYHCGHWDQAREEYRRVLATQPRCFEAAQSLGWLLLQEQKGQEAAQVFAAALQADPPILVAASLEAHRLEAEAHWDEAAAAYDNAIALDPTEKANYYGLHRTLACLSRYREQLDNLACLRALDPHDIFAFHEAYTPCARLERWEDARQLLEQAVALDPHYPIAVKHLFQVRMNLHLYDAETLRLAEKLVEIAPEFAESWAELAWFYQAQGQAAEGLALLHTFLEKHPTNAQAHAFLAWGYHYEGGAENATRSTEHARRAYALAPGDWYVCWTIVMALGDPTDSSRRDESLQIVDDIAARFPGDAFLLDRVATVDSVWGRSEQAIARAKQVVGLDPESPLALGALAAIYLKLQRWAEAVENYRSAIQKSGGEIADFFTYCGLALSHFDPAEADRFWTAAWERIRSPDELVRLAVALEQADRRERALRAYRESLADPMLSGPVRRTAEEGLGRLQ